MPTEKDIIKGLKTNSDAYYNAQVQQFNRQRDDGMAEINRAYNENYADGQTGIKNENLAYGDQKAQIDKNAYTQAQATNINAFNAGIQNSQQMLGLQMGDNARTNNLVQTAMTERDRRIADINDRLARILAQKNTDLAKVKTDYGYNIAGARAQADQMYNDAYSKFQMDLYMQALARAQASAGGGGGGGRPRGGSPGGTTGKKAVPGGGSGGLGAKKKAYDSVVAHNGLNGYYNSFGAQSLGTPPAPGNNPNMSAYDNYKIAQNDLFGGKQIATVKPKKTSPKIKSPLSWK